MAKAGAEKAATGAAAAATLATDGNENKRIVT